MFFTDRNGHSIFINTLVKNLQGKVYKVVSDKDLGICILSKNEKHKEKLTPEVAKDLQVVK